VICAFVCFAATAIIMDKLRPETRDMLILMDKIQKTLKQREDIELNKKTTRAPDEVVNLFRRERVDRLDQNVSLLKKATDQISEKDSELKILFCEANEMHDKQKDGTARLCRVTSDRHENIVNLLTSDLPAGDKGLDQAVKECDRLTGLMEKKSVQCTRTASELRNTLTRLEKTMPPVSDRDQSATLIECGK
jgi:ABC-type transporter Mla subunit MlaD